MWISISDIRPCGTGSARGVGRAESLSPEWRTGLSCVYHAGILLHYSRLQRRWACCCDLPAGCVEAYTATAALVLLGNSPSLTVSGVCTGFACRRRSRCSAFKRLRAGLLRASNRKLSGCFWIDRCGTSNYLSIFRTRNATFYLL